MNTFPPVSNLVSHYKLNDNLATSDVIDSRGNNPAYIMNFQNTEDFSVPGKIDKAFHFSRDGFPPYTHSYSARSDSFPNPLATNYGITMWFKTTWKGYPLFAFTSMDRMSPGIYTDDDGYMKYKIEKEDAGEDIIKSDSSSLNDNSWHHIAITLDSSVMKMWIDGAIQSETLSLTGTPRGDSVIWIGGGRLQAWEGYVDDVRIYNCALTTENVLAIYNYGSGTEATDFPRGAFPCINLGTI